MFVLTNPWLPEFIVQSREDKSREFRDYEVWCQRWEKPNPMPAGLHFHRTIDVGGTPLEG